MIENNKILFLFFLNIECSSAVVCSGPTRLLLLCSGCVTLTLPLPEPDSLINVIACVIFPDPWLHSP